MDAADGHDTDWLARIERGSPVRRKLPNVDGIRFDNGVRKRPARDGLQFSLDARGCGNSDGTGSEMNGNEF